MTHSNVEDSKAMSGSDIANTICKSVRVTAVTILTKMVKIVTLTDLHDSE
jgi:hypothetical protein